MSDGRIQAGQNIRTAISARAWNRAQEAADLVLGGRPSLQGGPIKAGGVPYTWCYAKNTTEDVIPRWGVLSIDGLEITPTSESGGATAQFEAMPVVTGVVPQTGDKSWVVALEPIGADKIGRVAVSGVVQCKINVEDENTSFVKIIGDRLESAGTGEGAILWKEDGEGEDKWALIRFGAGSESKLKLGKTVASWTKGTSQAVELWPAGEQSDPIDSEEAYNVFADIEEDKWVMIAQEDTGAWYLIAAEC